MEKSQSSVKLQNTLKGNNANDVILNSQSIIKQITPADVKFTYHKVKETNVSNVFKDDMIEVTVNQIEDYRFGQIVNMKGTVSLGNTKPKAVVTPEGGTLKLRY